MIRRVCLTRAMNISQLAVMSLLAGLIHEQAAFGRTKATANGSSGPLKPLKRLATAEIPHQARREREQRVGHTGAA